VVENYKNLYGKSELN